MILNDGYLELNKANLFSNNPIQMHFYEHSNRLLKLLANFQQQQNKVLGI